MRKSTRKHTRFFSMLNIAVFVFFAVVKRILIKGPCLYDCCHNLLCQQWFYHIRDVAYALLCGVMPYYFFNLKWYNWQFLPSILIIWGLMEYFIVPILPFLLTPFPTVITSLPYAILLNCMGLIFLEKLNMKDLYH